LAHGEQSPERAKPLASQRWPGPDPGPSVVDYGLQVADCLASVGQCFRWWAHFQGAVVPPKPLLRVLPVRCLNPKSKIQNPNLLGAGVPLRGQQNRLVQSLRSSAG